MKFEFSWQIFGGKKSNLMKIRQAGAELFRAEGGRGHDDPNNYFSQFCEQRAPPPKKEKNVYKKLVYFENGSRVSI